MSNDQPKGNLNTMTYLKTLLIALAAATILGCGTGETPAASIESPLVKSQIWQSSPSGPSVFEGYGYSCGGAFWSVRESIAQTTSASSGLTITTINQGPSGASDSSLNEVQVRCPTTDMTDQGTYLYNGISKSCSVYAHPAGQGGWTFSVSATIAAVNFRYAPIGQYGYANGYWDLTLNLPSNPNQWGTGYGMGCFGLGGAPEIYAF